jgi:mRNA deadenylase 3'-5' endonuclease subunit Ccr4
MNTKKAPASFANRKQILIPGVDDVTAGHVFSLMSYNILADCHTSSSTYPYRDSAHLDIQFRHKHLLKELRYLDCDVICLQEVGPGYFKDTLEPELQKLVTYMVLRM